MAQIDKQAMKALREERAGQVERAKTLIKAHNKEADAIREALATGEATVPDLAVQTGLAADRVLFHVATLRKFGAVVEADKDGDYFRYRLAETTDA